MNEWTKLMGKMNVLLLLLSFKNLLRITMAKQLKEEESVCYQSPRLKLVTFCYKLYTFSSANGAFATINTVWKKLTVVDFRFYTKIRNNITQHKVAISTKYKLYISWNLRWYSVIYLLCYKDSTWSSQEIPKHKLSIN